MLGRLERRRKKHVCQPGEERQMALMLLSGRTVACPRQTARGETVQVGEAEQRRAGPDGGSSN